MSNPNCPHEARVAVLVDCDDVPTDIVEHAFLMLDLFGRVMLRRGYGHHAILADKQQEVLVRQTTFRAFNAQYASARTRHTPKPQSKPLMRWQTISAFSRLVVPRGSGLLQICVS
ncbi:hypothetical protein [Xanthomonas euvesicatoria]|uniref:NYN domain-containing protein n=1 Tax=Xanthomonas euvesicatoria TaxID=456327 RepID=A0AAW3U2T3_XANEU|nr:hypothetical protein [Xanthomonas euvesicatoria]MBB4723337.1 hypothetical protein [Xanthomonas euvesicatoria]MBB4870151.1 hypothetical protein [Xanthomonas euvesicatoria]